LGSLHGVRSLREDAIKVTNVTWCVAILCELKPFRRSEPSVLDGIRAMGRERGR
jgi:hypothetical protein